MVLLTRNEVAAFLGVTIQWLNRAADRGDGPPMIRLSGGTIRYDNQQLRDWLTSRSRVPARACNRRYRRSEAA